MSTHSHSCTPYPHLAKLVTNHSTAPVAEPHIATEQTEGSKDPSHIFIGRVITMDDSLPEAEALAIKNSRVVAVGSIADIRSLAGKDTEVIELEGKVIYPGLIDSHMHLWVTAINYDWLDCSVMANKSLDDIKNRIAKAAKAAKPGEWILGKLFDPSMLPGMPDLTTKDLDPLAPNNPVFIFNASMHFAYVNSKALEVAGITKDSPDPPGGYYGRYDNGAPNGILSEMSTVVPFLQHIDSITPEVIAKNITRILDDSARVGVTSVREAATGALLGDKEIGLLHHVQQHSGLKARVSLALVDDLAKTWPESENTANGSGNEYVWVGARKIVTDGSNQGESGYQTKPYLHSKDRGKLDIDPDELKKRLQWCHDNNWQVMMHANGDAAVDAVVKTCKEVLGDGDGKDLRHRIEHCSLVNDDARFDTMAELGVSPSFLINHVYYWGKTLRDNVLGKDRIYMLDRTAAAAKAGLKFTLHSDYNVSPINPLHYVYVAVNRIMWDGGEVLEPDQRVDVQQALKAVTIDAAWQMHREDKFGSLTPGKYADFVILDKDPQQVKPTEIDKIKVKQTWLGGKITYKSS